MTKVKSAALMVSALALTAAAGVAAPAFAQSNSDDEIVVTGSRGKPRAVKDSAVPIDVIGTEEVETVSFADTNDILKTLVPSYSLSRQPISDGATFIRPASLRGLPTDKTLVLVNSKRRHRAALVQIGGAGTQGPDIATIPATAIKTVEVLRDGAAAQYGTDAIAGVINFLLKDNSDGATLTAQVGQHYAGDGEQYIVGGNIGFGLGGSGFLSLSGEVSSSNATVRAEQYCESWFCLDPNGDSPLSPEYNDPTFFAGTADANIGSGDVVQPWGSPDSEATRFFFNAGYDFENGIEAYAFGNYSESKANGSFFYRYPGNGTIEDLRLEDGSIYSPLEIYPGGFTPRFFGEVTDKSLTGGLKGEWNDILWDFSARFGENKIAYTLANTINPSLGPDTPTSFRPGDLINTETQLQADFVKEFDVESLASPLTLGFGLSYLDESYDIVGGEEASYVTGPFASADPFSFCNADGTPTAAGSAVIANGSTLDCSNPDDPVYTAVGVGSNGFPGYSPAFSGKYTRDSYAGYLEMSADITDKFFLQAAARYEDYSDFGEEVIGKIAGKYDVTDSFGIRASASTGFRAPTPGQQGTTNVSTRLPNGFPVATGLFPAGGPIAGALGAVPLKPEKSVNFTLGLVGDVGPIGYTVDFYQIDINDRFNAVSTQDVSTDPNSGAAYQNFLALQAAGVAGAGTIGGVFWFSNAFDTRTQGVDVVLTADKDWGDAGTTDFVLSFNHNEVDFQSDIAVVGNLFNAESRFDFIEGFPKDRATFGATHSVGSLTATGRLNYYGPYTQAGSGAAAFQDFSEELFVDVDMGYRFNDHFSASIGARNLFDNYPDKGDDAISDTCCGRVYRSDSIVDWQGGYYYAKVRLDM